jgi:CRISPR-associated endonuclease/helicase Cas3
MTFPEFFAKATQGGTPYPYQQALATVEPFPELLSIPTGLGKTAAVILGWLYRRRFHNDANVRNSTPRRLIYCFPMRVLVEQTVSVAQGWLDNLGIADTVAVSKLMGGVDPDKWDEHPEQDAILVGTQDMLLSRALNRGFGMSRYRWPMHFGLLNNDSLWVMDETQLMGVGLTTTAQLQGLRAKLNTYGGTKSLWMSATLDTTPLRTVDHPEPASGYAKQTLTAQDLQQIAVQQRINSTKPLELSKLILNSESEKKSYAKDLAAAIKDRHEQQPGTLTLAVLNRVARAQEVFIELEKLCKKGNVTAELAVIHARFRPHDRQRHEQRLFDKTMPASGRIVIATQAIEAGVDVSAATLFTELAPWPSLVQRFGRCNRGGEFSDSHVIWIDAQAKDDKDRVLLPYAKFELDQSREYLERLKNVGSAALEATQQRFQETCEQPIVHTIRRKDLLDLWDTTPDLAGNDLDVSRFIRDSDDTDVQFFWREFENDVPNEQLTLPRREELCSVTIGRAREFLAKLKKNKSASACTWNSLEAIWKKIDPDDVRPGMVLLLKPEMGGYLDTIGWTGDPANKPSLIAVPPTERQNPRMESDPLSEVSQWVSLTNHLRHVAQAVEALHNYQTGWDREIPWPALTVAAWWHDVGKSHPAFQNMLLTDREDAETLSQAIWAKSARSKDLSKSRSRPMYTVNGAQGIERRTGFRHELASALAWLQHRGTEPEANLIAYLIAAHHGKVRGSIRSLPNEVPPPDVERKFARGIWGGDLLPEVVLGNGETIPPTTLDLTPMKLGYGADGASWLGRVLALRDDAKNYGPFRLAFLEMLIRVADWRGTQAGEILDAN